jgi:hypothetical protein
MHQKMAKNAKEKLSLSISKHCTMQMYGDVEINVSNLNFKTRYTPSLVNAFLGERDPGSQRES